MRGGGRGGWRGGARRRATSRGDPGAGASAALVNRWGFPFGTMPRGMEGDSHARRRSHAAIRARLQIHAAVRTPILARALEVPPPLAGWRIAHSACEASDGCHCRPVTMPMRAWLGVLRTGQLPRASKADVAVWGEVHRLASLATGVASRARCAADFNAGACGTGWLLRRVALLEPEGRRGLNTGRVGFCVRGREWSLFSGPQARVALSEAV